MLTIPNLLTLLRLLLVPCFIGATLRGMYTAALIIFVTAAVTDVFDGMIARRLNQRSRIGALLDPAADKTLMISGYILYTVRDVPVLAMPGWLTFTALVRDCLIVMFAYLLYTRVHVRRFPPSWAGKTSTLIQAVTLGAVIAVNAFAPPPAFVWATEAMFRVTLAITLYSSWDYLRKGKKLLEEGLRAAA